jgi:N-methylhydantoinase B
MDLDPVTLVVIQNGLRSITNEMDLVHQKASFSPIISESFDRANGIYHRNTGEVIAQGDTSLANFVGVMQFTTQAVIEHCKDVGQGDIIVVNDPYFGGTHLMDVKMVSPFFYRGKLWCWLTNSGHWPDTGGMVPGGFATSATEIQQEGLRLPPVKLFRAGEVCQDVVDIILSNIRVPEERIGDIKAQVGALRVGARRLTELLDRYGADLADVVVDELRVRSERQMRSHIEAIPDGDYSFESQFDSDGVVNRPLTVHLDVKVQGSDMHFDLSKSSPPCRGPLNSVWAITQTAIYVAIKHIFADVPINSGCFKPLHIEPPRGTFLYAEYPRPVSGCAAEVSQRLINVVFGAMAQAIPDQVVAGAHSTSGNFTLGGFDPATGKHYVMVQFSGGGYGGSIDTDGLTNGSSSISVSKTPPIEIMEQRYPILFEEYALREGSAGAGRQRGGFGLEYRLKIIRGEGNASFLMEHGKSGPHGILGGGTGAFNEVEIFQEGTVSRLPHVSKGDGYLLRAGDSVHVKTPGGGGYGKPTERDRALVERDLEREYITPEEAQKIYGLKAQI